MLIRFFRAGKNVQVRERDVETELITDRIAGATPGRRWTGAVLILGMHRSGTSCLAGSLQALGLALGRVHEWNPHNLKGNREHPGIMNLNDAVLAHSGGAWDHPPAHPCWSQAHARERDAILAELSRHASGAWGFKDPRTLLLLPFWLEALERPRFVGTFRHPARVASSLRARGLMPVEVGLALWLTYNHRLLDLHSRSPFPLVSFDLAEGEYAAAIAGVAQTLGLPVPSARQRHPFFDAQLRGATADDADVPREALVLHAQLDAASRLAPTQAGG
jgi:hypothetical protein